MGKLRSTSLFLDQRQHQSQHRHPTPANQSQPAQARMLACLLTDGPRIANCAQQDDLELRRHFLFLQLCRFTSTIASRYRSLYPRTVAAQRPVQAAHIGPAVGNHYVHSVLRRARRPVNVNVGNNSAANESIPLNRTPFLTQEVGQVPRLKNK